MKSIELKNVAKQYHKREYYFSKKDIFWSLKDITFSVSKGEALGIIGANGAGKTTLMRIISGITVPTKGELNVRGRVVPLISVEGAFNFILTARENMLLLTIALGIDNRKRENVFQNIIEFSGIVDYLDMQVFKLSSGMISRFAFSIAAHVPSDILLIDEILAVGDEEFQNKCFKKIEQFKSENKTIIFVSHDLESVKNICQRVLWIDKGKIASEGSPDNVISQYIKYYKQ